jgi:hypothetical protein
MVLLSLIITFTIAYQVNIRKGKVYSMETLISVKEESNLCLRLIRVLFLTGVELLTRFKLFRLRYSRGRITN